LDLERDRDPSSNRSGLVHGQEQAWPAFKEGHPGISDETEEVYLNVEKGGGLSKKPTH
jgi:hypothetical protein